MAKSFDVSKFRKDLTKSISGMSSPALTIQQIGSQQDHMHLTILLAETFTEVFH